MPSIDSRTQKLAVFADIVRVPGNILEQPPHTDFKRYLFEYTDDAMKASRQDRTQPNAVRDAMMGTLERLTLAAQEYHNEHHKKQQITYPFEPTESSP